MKEPLNHKFLNFFVPIEKAPVRGYNMRLTGGSPQAGAVDQGKIKLKGANYHMELPFGAGVAVKELGLWSWVQPEFPVHVKSAQTDIELDVPAHNDVKIAFRGSTWILQLERDYSAADLEPHWADFRRTCARAVGWVSLALFLHVMFWVIAEYVPLKPIAWIEKISQPDAPEMTFNDKVIEDAKKNTPENADDNVIKVKFNFFNGVPWMDQKKVSEEKVARLDSLLKDLKGLDTTVGYDDKGAKNAQEVLNQQRRKGGGEKGTLISQVFKNSKSNVVPKLSALSSTNRELSAEELKIIRAAFQAIVPEMTLAYQRALIKDQTLAFGLRYETTVNAKGYLSQVKLSTTGGKSAVVMQLLNEIKGIFEKTNIGTKLSGVTVQGENVFRNQ